MRLISAVPLLMAVLSASSNTARAQNPSAPANHPSSSNAPATPDVFLDALQSFQRGDYAAAETGFQQAVKDGREPRARAFLAITQASTGRCPVALPALREAWRAKSADPQTARLTGLALVQCETARANLESASQVAAQLIAKYPDDADVLYQAARLHLRAWNEVVRNLFERAPSSYRVDQLSAEIFEIQGSYTQAIDEYRKAIAKNPKAIDLHYRLGRATLLASHDAAALEQAQTEFQAELLLNPNDSVAMYQIAQILLAQEKPADAEAMLQRALQASPDFAEVLLALGKLQMSAKHYPEAVATLERADKLMPGSETAKYNLMLAYRNVGRAEDARRVKEEIDRIRKPPEGEFTEFLKKLGEPAKP